MVCEERPRPRGLPSHSCARCQAVFPKPLATVSACRPEKAGAGRAVRSSGVPVLACACGGREAATEGGGPWFPLGGADTTKLPLMFMARGPFFAPLAAAPALLVPVELALCSGFEIQSW